MCGRYGRWSRRQRIEELLGIEPSGLDDFTPLYNVTPGVNTWIARAKDGQPGLHSYLWGLVTPPSKRWVGGTNVAVAKRKAQGSSNSLGDQPSPRNVVQVALRDASDKAEDAIARTLTRPSVQAAATIQRLTGDTHEVNALARELSAQIEAANSGPHA
jgi:hypothetical protein